MISRRSPTSKTLRHSRPPGASASARGSQARSREEGRRREAARGGPHRSATRRAGETRASARGNPAPVPGAFGRFARPGSSGSPPNLLGRSSFGIVRSASRLGEWLGSRTRGLRGVRVRGATRHASSRCWLREKRQRGERAGGINASERIDAADRVSGPRRSWISGDRDVGFGLLKGTP